MQESKILDLRIILIILIILIFRINCRIWSKYWFSQHWPNSRLGAVHKSRDAANGGVGLPERSSRITGGSHVTIKWVWAYIWASHFVTSYKQTKSSKQIKKDLHNIDFSARTLKWNVIQHNYRNYKPLVNKKSSQTNQYYPSTIKMFAKSPIKF